MSFFKGRSRAVSLPGSARLVLLGPERYLGIWPTHSRGATACAPRKESCLPRRRRLDSILHPSTLERGSIQRTGDFSGFTKWGLLRSEVFLRLHPRRPQCSRHGV